MKEAEVIYTLEDGQLIQAQPPVSGISEEKS
jgi:hypothetical protein